MNISITSRCTSNNTNTTFTSTSPHLTHDTPLLMKWDTCMQQSTALSWHLLVPGIIILDECTCQNLSLHLWRICLELTVLPTACYCRTSTQYCPMPNAWQFPTAPTKPPYNAHLHRMNRRNHAMTTLLYLTIPMTSYCPHGPHHYLVPIQSHFDSNINPVSILCISPWHCPAPRYLYAEPCASAHTNHIWQKPTMTTLATVPFWHGYTIVWVLVLYEQWS